MINDNPVLLPLNKEKTIYGGFITVQERDFRVRITLPPDRKITGGRLHCCWQLKHLLRGYEQTVKQVKTQTHSSVRQVKTQTHSSVRQVKTQTHSSVRQVKTQTHSSVRLLFIDTAFQTLQLNAEDSSGRQHLLTVKLKPKHPAEAPDCSADLPLPLLINWTPQTTLDQLYGQFLLVLESLTRFWDVLDEIDRNTWILEPEKPCRSDTMRRIAIGNNVSIKVEVDPRHPEMLPDCCLLGAEHVVTPLRNKLNTNMHLWNPESDVLHNLQDVLEIEFPSPASHEKSSFSTECGICYSYRLEDSIPDQVCNDPRCGQPFHQACLYEWLRGLPSSRQSFSVIFGDCPYCSKVGVSVSRSGFPLISPEEAGCFPIVPNNARILYVLQPITVKMAPQKS
uniref:FA complementation group L n=1 Tax=Takifugu rubripes TaxID=31033 RepID=A0A674NFY9_TAKRU